METQSGILGHFLSLSGGRNAETMLQKIYVYIVGFFFLQWFGFSFCRFGRAFFLQDIRMA
jgi:hypothetical protein